MAQELGTGYIIIQPSTKGLGKAIEGSIDTATTTGSAKSSKTLLQRLGGTFGKIGKIGVAATSAIGGAVVGLAAKGGFDRALNIERAQTKLKALGHDTKSIDGIMSDALASVKGTAFGLGDAASVAAQLVASGVKQGKELENALTLVGDAAQVAGVEFTDMGTIFSKVAATGHLQGDEMNQLMEAGIPVLQDLAEHYGITADEAREMVSDGKVTFADFSAAMQEHFGGAAQRAGESFDGAMANAKAALSRLGEKAWTPILKGMTSFFNTAIPLVDEFTEKMGPGLQRIGEKIQSGLENALPAITGFFSTVHTATDGLRRGLANAFSRLGEALSPAMNKLKTTFLTVAAGIKNQFSGDLISMTDSIGVSIQGLAGRIAPGLETITLKLASAFKDAMPSVQSVMDSLGTAFTTVKDLATQFWDAFTNAGGSTQSLSELGSLISALTSPFGAVKLIAEQFGDSLQSLAQSVIPTLGGVFGNLVSTMSNVAGTVLPTLGQAFNALAPLVGQVVQAGGDLANAVLPIVSDLMQGLTPIISTVTSFFGQFASSVAKLISGALPTLVNILTTVGDVLGGVIAAILPSINSVMQSLLPVIMQVTNAVGQIAQSVLPTVSSLLQTLAPYISRVAGYIGQLAEMLAPLIAQLVSSLLPVITQVVDTVMSFVNMIMPVLTPLIEAVMAGIEALMPIIQTVLTVVTDVVSGILAAIQWIIEGVQNLFDFMSPIIQAISTVVTGTIQVISSVWNAVWSTIQSVFMAVWNAINGFVTTVLGGIANFISSTINAVKATWTAVWNAINSVISTVWNGIKSVVSGAINAVKSTISSVLNAIKGVWDSMWNGIRNGISAVWNGIKSGVTNGINAVMNSVRGIKDSITGFFSGAGSWLLDSGRKIIEGLGQGISSAFNGVKNMLSNGLQSLRNLLPFSPAKEGPFSGHGWTLYSGRSIMQAMAQGIEDETDGAVKTMDRAMGRLYRSANSANTGKYGGGFDLQAQLDEAVANLRLTVPWDGVAPLGAYPAGKTVNYTIEINGERLDVDRRLANLLDELVDACGVSLKART